MKLKEVFIFSLIITLCLNVLISQESENQSQEQKNISAIELIALIPTTFKIGDVQFDIRVKNNYNKTLENLMAFVTGNGFSTYEVIGIDLLEPQEKNNIIVFGNFKESGNITLMIKIDKNIFYRNVTVIDDKEENEENMMKQKIETLNNLSQQLFDLKQRYYKLELEYNNKKSNNYEVSDVNLEPIKKYIEEIELDINNENIKNAKAKLSIANEIYTEEKNKLENAKQKSFILILKDYAFIFSTIAGALVTFFVLSELLKKKSEGLIKNIKKIKKKKYK